MEPNDNTPDQPVVPTTPGPTTQPEQATSGGGTSPDLTDEAVPVSPLQAITTPEEDVSEPTTNTEVQPTTSEELTTSAQPTGGIPVAPDKKKSKTTTYLVIVLGVAILIAAGLYVYTLL